MTAQPGHDTDGVTFEQQNGTIITTASGYI